MRATCLLLFASLLLVLPSCGFANSGDQIVFSAEPPPDEYDTIDDDLRAALAAAGVEPVSKPQSEDPALVELGRALFFDKVLSGNRNISCATCHHPAAFTGDSLPVSLGEGGTGLGANRTKAAAAFIPRNAPQVFNGGVSGVNSMFWDSRLTRDPVTGELDTPEAVLNGPTPSHPAAQQLTSALAAQAMFPVTSHEEMRGQTGSNEIADAANNTEVWDRLMTRLGAHAGYQSLFAAAYPGAASFNDYNFGHAARAIAAFERQSWTALYSPFDRYVGGDDYAMSAAQKKGALLFYGRAGCSSCHNGPLLTDFGHHALAMPQLGPGKDPSGDDIGLELETGDVNDRYKFRTPPLRNVALTGPWGHAGAYTSLEAVVRHHLDPANGLLNYDVNQLPAIFRPEVDTDPARRGARIAAISPQLVPVGLSEQDFAYLMDFLHSLTDPKSLNLLQDIPDSVPSGLPVKD